MHRITASGAQHQRLHARARQHPVCERAAAAGISLDAWMRLTLACHMPRTAGLLLENARSDFKGAERMYQRALNSDPKHVSAPMLLHL
jgi:hypothetical protein